MCSDRFFLARFLYWRNLFHIDANEAGMTYEIYHCSGGGRAGGGGGSW